MDDVCPHRLAPLSEGRLYQRSHEGRKQTILECGYHGWRFDCGGRCVDIPLRELSRSIPAAADVGGIYATRVAKCGMIFMWWGDRAEADDNTFPVPPLVETERDIMVFRNIARKFPLAFTTVLENVADPAHVPFAHHGTGQGDRNKVKRGGGGVLKESRLENGYLQVLFTRKDSKASVISEVQMPTCARFDIQAPKLRTFLLTWMRPVDWDDCVMFSTFVSVKPRRILKWLLHLRPRWWEHTIANLILDGDAMLLHGQEKRLQDLKKDGYGSAWKKNYTLASGNWDVQVIELRKFLDKYGPTMPFLRPPRDVPRVVHVKAINNRYENHTKHCGSCAPALKNIKAGIAVALVAAGVCALASLFAGILLISVKAGYLSRARLAKIGIGGLIGCLIALGFASLLNGWNQLLTFTDISYRLSHTD